MARALRRQGHGHPDDQPRSRPGRQHVPAGRRSCMPAASSRAQVGRGDLRDTRRIPTRRAWSIRCPASASARGAAASVCAKSRASCLRSPPIPAAAASIRAAPRAPRSAARSRPTSRPAGGRTRAVPSPWLKPLLTLDDLAVHLRRRRLLRRRRQDAEGGRRRHPGREARRMPRPGGQIGLRQVDAGARHHGAGGADARPHRARRRGDRRRAQARPHEGGARRSRWSSRTPTPRSIRARPCAARSPSRSASTA